MTSPAPPPDFRQLSCRECMESVDLGFDFSMAFQPIVDLRQRTVFAYEALVRGPHGEPAASVFSHVNDRNRYRFDQACRVRAIQLAAELRVPCLLSINFMPNAVYRPELCIRTTLQAAEVYGFPTSRLMFEVTEAEKVDDVPHVQRILTHYRERGFLTAIDDFGAGYSGLNLLADMPADLIKIDMALVRNIDSQHSRRAIVRGIVEVCRELGTRVIAEGVETRAELDALRALGIDLMQGFYFAAGAFRELARVPEDRWS